MIRAIFKKISDASTQSFSPLINHVSKRFEHDQAGWIKPDADPATFKALQDAGLREDHPQIYNATEVQKNGKVPIKGNTTDGPGLPTNPSQPLHSSLRVNGTLNPERIVPATKPVLVDIKDLSPIPKSSIVLNDSYTKHNMHKAGVTPSKFKDGTPYVPPGQTE